MKYTAVLFLLISTLIAQNKPDEQDYISATEYFNSNLNILTGNNSNLAFEMFGQIKNRYSKIFTDYPGSDLKDDAQLAIAVAAGKLNDLDIFNLEVEKVFTDYPGGRINHLNFTNSVCNALLPAVQSTFVETDAYAQYLLGMAYFSTTLLPSVQDYNIAISKFEKVIEDFPLSLMAAYSQYYIARAYDYLSHIDGYENTFVIGQYEIVTDKYYNYSCELAENSFGRTGDFITLNGPVEKYDYFDDKIKNIYTDENYIAESRFQNKKNLRWTDTSINIYFAGSGLTLTPADSSVALTAAQTYAAALNNLLNFNFVSQENIADIVFSFSSTLGNFTQTFTKKKDDQVSEITSAKIYLKTSGEIDKRKEIALHEMGHALGLDHSFDPDDNMFFLGNGSASLSQRDIKTLSALYSPENIAPVLLSTLYTPRMEPGEKLFFDLDAQDLDKGIPEFSLIGAPGWLVIDPISGVLEGIPAENDSGYYNLEIRLSDAHGAVVDYNWKFLVSNNKSFTGMATELPSGFELGQNYPNPFNCSTIIEFALNKNSNVKLEILNTLGERVIELINRPVSAGRHSINFNAGNLPSGVYFYRISADNKINEIKKMLLLK